MVTFSDLGVVGGMYQTASALPPQGLQRTVKGFEAVTMNDNGQQTLKPVLHFAEAGALSLVLNKTNRTILERAWSTTLESWVGRTLVLRPIATTLRGQPVTGITVQPALAAAAPMPQPVPTPQPAPTPTLAPASAPAPVPATQPAAPAAPTAGTTTWDNL